MKEESIEVLQTFGFLFLVLALLIGSLTGFVIFISKLLGGFFR